MPRSLISSVGVGVNRLSPDEEEDNDICPVCDGDCTCNNRPRLPPPSVVSSGAAHYVTTPTASTSSSGRVPGLQSLKIKLTVPPSMQNKPRSPAALPKKHRGEASNGCAGSNNVSPFHNIGQSHHADSSSTAGRGNQQMSDVSVPKRRGRPPKATIIHRESSSFSGPDRPVRGNEATTLSQSQSRPQSRVPLSSGLNTSSLVKGNGKQKSNTKASRRAPSSHTKATITKKTASSKKRAYFSDNSECDLDLDDQSIDTTFDEDNEDDDASSAHFPTFLPADDLVSTASESSESDSDSTGFESDWSLEAEEESYILTEERRHDRARVRRELLGDEGPKRKDAHNNWVIRPRKRSVGLSDVEMDGDTDEATEDEEENEEDEMDEGEDEDEIDGQSSRLAYTGVATGWSGDESSFDADLFFANLSDTSTDGSSSDEDDAPPASDAGNEEMVDSISSLPRSVDFEVTEGWDGQLVFTNGSTDGRGVLDVAFEATAAQFITSDNTSVSHDSDIEMRSNSSEEGESELGEDDGDTTEEELVDDKGLPTSRAMRLFRWPTSISAINPLSTVSPSCSPGPSRRRSATASQIPLGSPRPADILAGKVFLDTSDDHSQGSPEGSRASSPRIISSGGVPVMGQFTINNCTPQRAAVLTGANKDVPSPFPGLGHKRTKDRSSSVGSLSSKDLRDRTTRLSLYTPSLLPPSDEPSSETTPEIGLGEPIQLHDVLDTTFIDSEPEVVVHTTSGSDKEHQKHAQSLNRWDHVPVHAFRLTRESTTSTGDIPTSPGWTSEPAKSTVSNAHAFDMALRSSPLNMFWQDKSAARPTSRRTKALIADMLTSPVLSPNREGDRTPTRSPHRDSNSNRRQEQNHKNRKESRREMKLLKRKGRDPVHQRHYYHQKQHFRHNHHPNMKTRSSGSMQRTNFHSSPTSIPALNI